jgi:hypothetical protein
VAFGVRAFASDFGAGFAADFLRDDSEEAMGLRGTRGWSAVEADAVRSVGASESRRSSSAVGPGFDQAARFGNRRVGALRAWVCGTNSPSEPGGWGPLHLEVARHARRSRSVLLRRAVADGRGPRRRGLARLAWRTRGMRARGGLAESSASGTGSLD